MSTNNNEQPTKPTVKYETPVNEDAATNTNTNGNGNTATTNGDRPKYLSNEEAEDLLLRYCRGLPVYVPVFTSAHSEQNHPTEDGALFFVDSSSPPRRRQKTVWLNKGSQKTSKASFRKCYRTHKLNCRMKKRIFDFGKRSPIQLHQILLETGNNGGGSGSDVEDNPPSPSPPCSPSSPVPSSSLLHHTVVPPTSPDKKRVTPTDTKPSSSSPSSSLSSLPLSQADPRSHLPSPSPTSASAPSSLPFVSVADPASFSPFLVVGKQSACLRETSAGHPNAHAGGSASSFTPTVPSACFPHPSATPTPGNPALLPTLATPNNNSNNNSYNYNNYNNNNSAAATANNANFSYNYDGYNSNLKGGLSVKMEDHLGVQDMAGLGSACGGGGGAGGAATGALKDRLCPPVVDEDLVEQGQLVLGGEDSLLSSFVLETNWLTAGPEWDAWQTVLN